MEKMIKPNYYNVGIIIYSSYVVFEAYIDIYFYFYRKNMYFKKVVF